MNFIVSKNQLASLKQFFIDMERKGYVIDLKELEDRKIQVTLDIPKFK
jgi:hypothetical protein